MCTFLPTWASRICVQFAVDPGFPPVLGGANVPYADGPTCHENDICQIIRNDLKRARPPDWVDD